MRIVVNPDGSPREKLLHTLAGNKVIGHRLLFVRSSQPHSVYFDNIQKEICQQGKKGGDGRDSQ